MDPRVIQAAKHVALLARKFPHIPRTELANLLQECEGDVDTAEILLLSASGTASSSNTIVPTVYTPPTTAIPAFSSAIPSSPLLNSLSTQPIGVPFMFPGSSHTFPLSYPPLSFSQASQSFQVPQASQSALPTTAPTTSTTTTTTTTSNFGTARKTDKSEISWDILLKLTPEIVESIPIDINGNKFYRVVMKDVKKVKKVTDTLWNWSAATTSHNHAYKPNTAQLRRCKGSYICRNKSCIFMEVTKTVPYHSTCDSVCEYCEEEMEFIHCSAALNVFRVPHANPTHLDVFHSGTHTCMPEANHRISNDALEMLAQLKNATPRQIQQRVVSSKIEALLLGKATIKDLEITADGVVDLTKISNEKARIKKSQLGELGSVPWAIIEQLKVVTDKGSYPFIRSFSTEHTGESHDEPHVFKMSPTGVEFAKQLSNREDRILGDIYVHIDVNERKVKDWKEMALHFFHPILRQGATVATMESKFEDTETVELFFKRINDAIEIAFNPTGYTADAQGSIAKGIGNVFNDGTPLGGDRYRMCRFHVLQCKERHVKGISDPKLQKEFNESFDIWINSASEDDVIIAEGEIQSLLEQPACESVRAWFNWWYARRGHFMELTRGDAPSTNNMAEAMHRSWQHAGGYNLSLADAAIFDLGEALLLDAKLRAFAQGMKFRSSVPKTGVRTRAQLEEDYHEDIEFISKNISEYKHATKSLGSPITDTDSHRFDKDKRSKREKATHHGTEKISTREPQKKKSKVEPEGRGIPKRTRWSLQASCNYRKAIMENIGLVHIILPEQAEDLPQFTVLGTKKDNYNVTIGTLPSCTCMYEVKQGAAVKNKTHCKHIFFVLAKIFLLAVSDPLFYQWKYTKKELDELFSKAQLDVDPRTVNNKANVTTLKKLFGADGSLVYLPVLSRVPHGEEHKCAGLLCKTTLKEGTLRVEQDTLVDISTRKNPVSGHVFFCPRIVCYTNPKPERVNRHYKRLEVDSPIIVDPTSEVTESEMQLLMPEDATDVPNLITI